MDRDQLRCPGCGGVLSESRIENWPLQYCRNCWGILVGGTDLLALAEALRSYQFGPAPTAPPRLSDAENPRACPKCSAPMQHQAFGGPDGIAMETCARCSVNWLDRAELQKIGAASGAGAGAPFHSDYGDTC
jgi:Zn-finger nucleic acid-binding protein